MQVCFFFKKSSDDPLVSLKKGDRRLQWGWVHDKEVSEFFLSSIQFAVLIIFFLICFVSLRPPPLKRASEKPGGRDEQCNHHPELIDKFTHFSVPLYFTLLFTNYHPERILRV